ncbi:MAG TPA: hypothetical protein VMB51_01025 [Solirubrobacteraceae bacterium]|nr:hypothetical protein [Solirubrobacteraceae bacterium]
MTFALFGLPSLQSIIEAIAKGFFGALAGALVPGWLRHGTVATIQHLVALPDPASWTHVNQLQDDTIYLAASLMPVVLAVATLRYWTIGLTGAVHPASALARTAGAAGVLVAYPWIITQTVAATNTLTHAILGFPAVSEGLERIISVLFGGALLSGAGGVFGALLVILGVFVAAGLFALQVLLTVVLALLIVAGPPLIVLSAIPELSHLARTWASTLLSIALIPLGWTLLFATAGALALDASSFGGGAGGLPEHVSAAFAGLTTFAIAVKLPLMALGEVRHKLTATSLSAPGTRSAQTNMPGAERISRAHARLRAVALEGAPSLGRSLGTAAGALGAPAGGPLGAARRGLAGIARHRAPERTAADNAGGVRSSVPGRTDRHQKDPQGAGGKRRGLRERVTDARRTLTQAPSQARDAVRASERRPKRTPAHSVPAPRSQTRGAAAPSRHTRTANRQTRTGSANVRTQAASSRSQTATGAAPRSQRGAAPKRSTGSPAVEAKAPAPAKPPTGPDRQTQTGARTGRAATTRHTTDQTQPRQTLTATARHQAGPRSKPARSPADTGSQRGQPQAARGASQPTPARPARRKRRPKGSS